MILDDMLRLMQAHADAWNSHDVDKLLELMTDDCIYDASAGSSPEGKRYVGHQALRSAFEQIWTAVPDARWEDPHHLVSGDSGITTWTFRGTTANGTKIELQGLDVLRIRDGRICHKDTYRKTLLA